MSNVKYLGSDIVEGTVAFGPVAGGVFGPRTDLRLDLIDGDRPLLLAHGTDATVGTSVLGRIKDYEVDPTGLWVRGQLDARSRWRDHVVRLLEGEALTLAMGTSTYLAKTDKATGELLRWPWIEASLVLGDQTVRGYSVKSADAAQHLVATGASVVDQHASALAAATVLAFENAQELARLRADIAAAKHKAHEDYMNRFIRGTGRSWHD